MDNGRKLRGAITDWGGVLSAPILTSVRAWIDADGIDWESYRAVMRPWVFQAYGIDGGANPDVLFKPLFGGSGWTGRRS